MAEVFRSSGILFVPLPVLNEEDYLNLISQIQSRLDILEKEARDA